MKKHTNTQLGFSVVEVLLVVIVLAAIGFGGYYVWNNQNKTDSKQTTSNKSQTTAKATEEKTQTNDYTGWKEYCESDTGICFKYPDGWTAKKYPNSDTIIPGNFISADKALQVGLSAYDSDATDFTIPSTLATISFDSLNEPKDTLKVWGGILSGDPSNIARYQVVDSKLNTADGLEVGKNKSFTEADYPAFTDTKTNKKYAFIVYDGEQDEPKSIDSAKQWFSSKNGKLALEVAQSLYIK